MQEISIRLKMIADLVTPGARVADIGCDHAYTDIYLASKGEIKSIIAMDLRKGPLKKARENVASAGYSDIIELRLSDGFEKLNKGETDTAIISGMGGRLITSIIEKGEAVFTEGYKLILSPQTEPDILRNYLVASGFVIEDEDMCFDEGKYYVAIIARYMGKDVAAKLTDEEALYGPVLIKNKNKVLLEYLDLEIKKRVKVIEELNKRLEDNLRKDDPGFEEKTRSMDKRIDLLNGEIAAIRRIF
ncbi:MAG: SAM-dependent methyltransferase [Eubacterium sp.]|nr:SAM-dependent methyltransferase [Eubacterium sp.]